jgi:hypothetical protein
MGMDKKGMVEILEIIRGNGEFKDVPVVWALGRTGPRMRVSQDVTGDGIRVRINYQGLGPVEIIGLANGALKHANDMYRSLTSASVVQSETPDEIERGGRAYVMTPGDLMEDKPRMIRELDAFFSALGVEEDREWKLRGNWN